jgi:hypothetical protein
MDHDFCLAWNWPYDADFVGLVEAIAGRLVALACQTRFRTLA